LIAFVVLIVDISGFKESENDSNVELRALIDGDSVRVVYAEIEGSPNFPLSTEPLGEGEWALEHLEHTNSPQLRRRESLLSKKRRMSAIRSNQNDKSRWKRETYIPPPFNSHFENETNLPPAHKVDLFVSHPSLSSSFLSFASPAIDQRSNDLKI